MFTGVSVTQVPCWGGTRWVPPHPLEPLSWVIDTTIAFLMPMQVCWDTAQQEAEKRP